MIDRHLEWDGCYNARDLGGLAAGSRVTRVGAVVRADAPDRLTGAGWAAVRDHGIRTVVDLRDPDERGAAGGGFRGARDAGPGAVDRGGVGGEGRRGAAEDRGDLGVGVAEDVVQDEGDAFGRGQGVPAGVGLLRHVLGVGRRAREPVGEVDQPAAFAHDRGDARGPVLGRGGHESAPSLAHT
nr:hypothetical protein GCM10017745_63760 [Saccharothrix mutabilis subsp. capreolus]